MSTEKEQKSLIEFMRYILIGRADIRRSQMQTDKMNYGVARRQSRSCTCSRRQSQNVQEIHFPLFSKLNFNDAKWRSFSHIVPTIGNINKKG